MPICKNVFSMSDINVVGYVLKRANMSKVSGMNWGLLYRHSFEVGPSLLADASKTIVSLLVFLSSLISG